MTREFIQKRLLCMLVISSLTVLSYAQKLEKSYADVEQMEISVGNGSLTVTKSNNGKVQVKGSYDSDYIELDIKHGGGFLRIEEENKRNNNRGSESEWIVAIPDGIKFKSNVGMGDVDMEGINAKISTNLGMGDLNMEDIEGKVSANTGMGRIKIEDSKGKFELNSGMKDITVRTSEGRFEANSGMGDVTFENVKITGSSSLNSGKGEVHFEIGAKLEGDLSLNTGMGDATLDFNGHKIEGDFEMKCGMKSGRIVAPFKFDKEEKVGWGNNGHIEKVAQIGASDYNIEISVGKGTAKVQK
jgi:hypothetical protein